MDYETLTVLYRSRLTLLQILKKRGYATAPYEKFGPVEVSAMASAGPTALRMDLQKAAEAAEAGGPSNCRVVYSFGKIKNRLATFLEELIDEEVEDRVDPATTEVIVVLLEPIAEAFHVAALNAAVRPGSNKLRIAFFQAHTLVNNPFDHVLVPQHDLLPAAEHADFLKANKIKSKTNLPIIKFHEDMIARLMGLQPGDIVKITRPSPTAGEYSVYRICAP
jgi:DNA-directed RNA polymerase I, II, and III subunit RPABC1